MFKATSVEVIIEAKFGKIRILKKYMMTILIQVAYCLKQAMSIMRSGNDKSLKKLSSSKSVPIAIATSFGDGKTKSP